MSEVNYVYLIDDGTAVKVGFTNNLKTRLRNLQTGSSRDLTFIATIETTLEKPEELESHVKDLFRAARIKKKRRNGEWYELTPRWFSIILFELNTKYKDRYKIGTISNLTQQ